VNNPSEETIFSAALECPTAAERAAYLDRACAGDPELRRRIEALVEARPQVEDFLEKPAAGAEALLSAERSTLAEPAELIGTLIARYRLRERIGEGGCGVVYVAEQEQPVRRRVALKIIKLGMDTRHVIARFEAERQVLAMMDHPNIAKVLDAGSTEAGRPYFVMELVRGVRITDYCDKAHLDTRQRLDLFIEVCQAVQHAHQKGIIHRDLKPSNILVTINDGRPVPKIIDFGIAKATAGRLTDKTIYTALHEFIGTPAYMSPEQAVLTSVDIDTRSDIYSLGVLLYELLTGRTPFDTRELLQRGFDEMRRTICEVEPPRPSTRLSALIDADLKAVASAQGSDVPKLVGILRGDLDWIVMKCLEKDRSRRYETANGLALDLGRYLSNEPITAHPPSAIYRLQKFARRNKLIVGASTAVIASMAVGLTIATMMFWREKREHDRAVKAESAEKQALATAQSARALSERGRLEEQKRAYSSDMKITQQLLERFDLEHAQAILNQYIPKPGDTNDLRDFVWRYEWQLCQGDPHDILPQPVPFPWSMEVSPDGQYLAVGSTAGIRGSVVVWRIATKEIVAHLERDPSVEGDVSWACFTGDGKMLATACHRRVKFFDTATWAERPELTITNVSGPIDIRGDTLVTMAPGYWGLDKMWKQIKVWNLQTRTSQTLTNVDGPPTLAPDGKRLVLNSPEGLKVWRTDQLEAGPLFLAGSSNLLSSGSGYQGLYRCLAFSPDGRKIATTGNRDSQRGEIPIIVWNAMTGARLDGDKLVGHQATIHGVAWSPDSRSIATCAADGTIRIWDVEGLTEVSRFLGHLSEPWAVVWGRDGQTVFSTGISPNVDRIKIWRLGGPARLPDRGQQWYPMWLSPDGNEVLACRDPSHAEYWNRADVHVLNPPPGLESLGDICADTMLITSNRPSCIFAAFTNGAVASWPLVPTQFPRLLQAHAGRIIGLIGTPDGKTLITCGTDKELHWWDFATGQLIRSNILSSPVTGLALSPDGATLVSASGRWDQETKQWRDLQLCWWDSQTGRLVSTNNLSERALEMGFSPNGRYLAVATDTGSDKHTLILDVPTKTWRASLDGTGRRIDFSPDSTKLLIRTTLWDLRTDPPVSKKLRGHRQMVFNLTFSPDSKTVVSTSNDSTVRLWNAETGQEMYSFFERGRCFDSPLFSADGTTLAVGVFRPDGFPVRFWRAPSLTEIDELIRTERHNH
jgi:serine/threonine protein kinase/WD40 repeat protein